MKSETKKTMRTFLKQNFYPILTNALGWRTNRKIVVIESDDWGSIRMESKQAYDYFLKKGLPVDQSPYNRYDALECSSDLDELFQALMSVKDKTGKPAVITANNVVANPDFEKIIKSGFQQYSYEPFTQTYDRYPQHSNSFKTMKEGLSAGVFYPQFHGREHLNIKRWMQALQDNDIFAHEAFKHNMFSLHYSNKPEYINEFMDALDFDSPSECVDLQTVIIEGARLFETIWGFPSESFMANCYIWSSELEPVLHQSGVNFIQGAFIQLEPKAIKGRVYKKKYHYLGQKNRIGQRYLIRNVMFEPSQNLSIDWIRVAMNEISLAFMWHKPAIISSHRLNYIGFIDPENRKKNVALLKRLLLDIKRKWPDVEFMTSVQLGEIINKNN